MSFPNLYSRPKFGAARWRLWKLLHRCVFVTRRNWLLLGREINEKGSVCLHFCAALSRRAGWKIKRKSQQTAAPWQARAFLNQISHDPALTKIETRYFLSLATQATFPGHSYNTTEF